MFFLSMLFVVSGSVHAWDFRDSPRFRSYRSDHRLQTGMGNMAAVLEQQYSKNGQRVASPQPRAIHLESGGDPFAGHLLFPMHKAAHILKSKPNVIPPRFRSLSQTSGFNDHGASNLGYANSVRNLGQYLPRIVSE